MSKKIYNNIKLNLMITLIIGALGFITNKYFSKYMGVDTLGLMRLFSQLIAYLSLAELGIGTATTYALYKPLADKNQERIDIVISTIDYFYKRIALFIFSVGMTLNFIVPFFLKENSYGNSIYIYWSLYVTNTALGYIFAKYSILYTADQKYDFVRKVQGSSKIIFQIIQIIFLIYIQSFTLYILIMILENLYNFYFFSKYYEKNYSAIRIVDEKDKGILKDIKNLFYHKIGTLIVHNTDFIVLSKFVSLSVVGIYSSYLIIYQMVMTIVNIGTPAITPVIGKFIAQNGESKEKIYMSWKKIYSIYMFIGTVFTVCTFFLINPFVKLWLGESYLLPKLTISLILTNLFIHITRNPIEIFKNNSGFFDDTYSPVLESIINLVLSLILVLSLGLNGVIIGTVVSNTLIIILLKPMLTFERCFGKTKLDYLKDFSKYLILAIIVAILSFGISNYTFHYLNFSSWLNFIGSTAIVGIFVLVLSSLVFILDRDFRDIFMIDLKLKEKLKRV